MQNINSKKVLFLCTGNYFRSRFAEEYFNARARESGCRWRSLSRAIHPDLMEHLRPEPISPFASEGLISRGILSIDNRFPRLATDNDFLADIIIVLCEREHRPYIEKYYARFMPRISWWHVEDVDRLDPYIAQSVIVDHVEALLNKYSGFKLDNLHVF